MADVAEFVAARLTAWGVERVFGLPGYGIDPLVSALGSGLPEFVAARHEESAALMACAHAGLTGRTGCCAASSGAGVLRLLTGLQDAALDRRPVVALVVEEAPVYGPDPPRRTVRTLELLAPVCEFCETVTEPALMGDALDRAFRAALAGRGPAAVTVARAVLESEAPESPGTTPMTFEPPVTRPRDGDLGRAAEVLNDGRKVAVVVGRDGEQASGQVVGVAGLLGAAVAKTPAARDALPDGLPGVVGVTRPPGSTMAAAVLAACDTVLLAGAADLDPETRRALGGRRVVAVGPGPPDGGTAVDAEVRVTGDVATALDGLIPLLRRKDRRGWRADVERAVEVWRAEGRAKAKRFFGGAVSPRAVVAELSARLPERAVVVTDVGSVTDWSARHLELRTGMRAVQSDGLGVPGASVPYALAARLAFPDRPVIALLGDGALRTGALADLGTVRGHLERFADLPPLVFCVLNNHGPSRLTWQRRISRDDPRLAPAQDADLDHAEYARLLGLPGVRCDRPSEVGMVWSDVLAAKGPVVLEFVVDGEMPPDWAEDAQEGRARPRSLLRGSRGGLRGLIGARHR